MITINGKQLRNLEEQVLKNKEDIAAHYNLDRVLADFGIHVVGQVSNEDDLPSPEDYVGEFGDAYAVGTEPPYSFYIWTRPSPDTGHDAAYWLDTGPLAIVGPQGPQGIQGLKGEPGARGNTFYILEQAPTTTEGYVVGDLVITPNNGNLYHLHKIGNTPTWLLEGNITGPMGPKGSQGIQGPQGIQGVQGPQGIQGRPGGTVTIIGVLDTVDQLPTASTVDLTSAYLVGTAAPYDLYVVTGTSSSTRRWTNAGEFNTGSILYEDGEYISAYDLSNKLSIFKPVGTALNKYKRVYMPYVNKINVNAYNTVWKEAINQSNTGDYPGKSEWDTLQPYNSPVLRGKTGNILLPPQGNEEYSPEAFEAISRSYADTHYQTNLIVSHFSGKLVLPVALKTYKGPVLQSSDVLLYPETVETTPIAAGTTIYFNDFSMSYSYSANTLMDYVDGYSYGTSGQMTVQVPGEGIYPVVYFNYHYAEDVDAADYCVLVYYKASEETTYCALYRLYNENDDGTSIEEAANEQLDTNYHIY